MAYVAYVAKRCRRGFISFKNEIPFVWPMTCSTALLVATQRSTTPSGLKLNGSSETEAAMGGWGEGVAQQIHHINGFNLAVYIIALT